MFRTKTTSEQAADTLTATARSAAEHAASLKERVGPAAEVALERATVAASTAKDWSQPHVEAARALLSEAAPVGRRLDFLCQEFNREANTLCSKSADLDLTRIGLALKAVIEQFREQVQNIE